MKTRFILPYSLYLAPRGLIHFEPFEGGFWRGGGLVYSSKILTMEIISLNCNELKIITQYISYNNMHMWGGLIKEEGLFQFFPQKGELIREWAYLAVFCDKNVWLPSSQSFQDGD